MAFTTPATSTAGTVLTASYLNTYVRDNIAWMATDSPVCRAYNTAAESIANVTFTALTFNSENFDNAAVHSTSSNTSRFTIPTGAGGKYLIGGCAVWANSAGGTYRGIEIRINGTTEVAAQQVAPLGAATTVPTNIVTMYPMAAADYVELTVVQDSGGALNVNAVTGGFESPTGWVSWMRT